MRFLGIPKFHRFLSRVSFYGLTLLLLWILGMMTPRARDAGAEPEPDVARVYIAEPRPMNPFAEPATVPDPRFDGKN